MATNTVTLLGWREFEAKVKGLPKVLFEEIDEEVQDAARLWDAGAKRDAPKDNGTLAGLISSKHVASMESEVTSGAFYSPFMEWGTKSKVSVPADLSGYASQFKGKGQGSYYDFLKAILAWVERKGIVSRFSVKTQKKLKHTKADDERVVQAAEAIAFHIMRFGVRPHPFFFIQRPLVQNQLNTNVQKILNTEH